MFIFLLTASSSDKHFLLYVLAEGKKGYLGKIVVTGYLLLWCSTFPKHDKEGQSHTLEW